jgi:hypothetical protein
MFWAIKSPKTWKSAIIFFSFFSTLNQYTNMWQVKIRQSRTVVNAVFNRCVKLHLRKVFRGPATWGELFSSTQNGFIVFRCQIYPIGRHFLNKTSSLNFDLVSCSLLMIESNCQWLIYLSSINLGFKSQIGQETHCWTWELEMNVCNIISCGFTTHIYHCYSF